MAFWDSLTDAERETELVLTPEQEAELDRRLEEHSRILVAPSQEEHEGRRADPAP